MKENMKSILSWLAIVVLGYLLISVLISMGIFNLYHIQIIETIGINVILAVGLNLIVGCSGQFSLGHAGYMAIGAYAVAIIGVKMPTYVGFLIAILVGTLVAGGIALGVGIPTLRLKGDYLAIATLGVAEIIRILLVNGGDITNGAAGIMGIPPFTTWSLVYGVAVVSLILAMNFLRSPLGRNTIAIREDEIAAESMGVDTTKAKVIVFVFGAILASIAGSLQAGYVGTVMPKDFSFMMSVNVLIIVVLGGLGSMTGTVLAAILLGLLNMLLQDYASVRMIIYALALILIMIFRPSGLLGTKELTLSHLFRKTSKGGN
ncbi:TPA: branched-chain amino acid ABC transporter permease [Streptococcus agalactiae]|nr:branched-chain amino acid ABC transporter permease [Streptococcus agalactiae]HEO4861429.1 branched-chain amino acid ABC transporter permease [Streptococcus agalactiae]